MSDGLQHCPTCDEEYVAGVAACVECGGPLQPGPLERLEQRGRAAGRPAAAADGQRASLTRLLAKIPGLQADHTVRALLLEGIACRVDCQGVVRSYAPDQPPAEPFAVTLPVSIFVADDQLDAAQDVLNSFESGDVIGEQWSDADAGAREPAEIAVDREAALVDDPQPAGGPSAESTSLRTVVLIVVAALVLLFLFGR